MANFGFRVEQMINNNNNPAANQGRAVASLNAGTPNSLDQLKNKRFAQPKSGAVIRMKDPSDHRDEEFDRF